MLYGVKLNDLEKISYSYDNLARLNTRTLNTASPFVTEYTYEQGAAQNTTTTLVKSIRNGNDTLSYIYDAVGNITAISENEVLKYTYTYDSLNQLKTETDSAGNVTAYTYDNGVNILSVTKNGLVIKSYGYSDTDWKDKMTAYNGQTITYDAIGNPLTYRNGMAFTWQNGRQLTGITKDSDNISYTYDDSGIRTKKTVNGVVTDYYLNGSSIVCQISGSDRMDYYYDENGDLFGFGYNGADYYYIRNGQNDIIGILDSTGTQVVSYTYNAWGECTVLQDTSNCDLSNKNPFRYRGYYYDVESGLYYVSSRYYDPETCRFINADNAISGTGKSVQGYNLFSYCFNNPVNMDDPTGNWPKWLEKAAKAVAVAAVVVTAVVVVAVATAGTGGLALAAAGVAFGTACGGLVGGIANEKKGESFINGWAGGAVNGFTQSLGTAAFGPAGTIAGGGVGSGLGTAVTESLNNRGKPKEQQKSAKVILNDSLKSAAIGTVMSTMTAGIGYGIDYAQSPLGYNSWAGSLSSGAGIAPITPGFGEMMKGFFGSVDDALVYMFCE